MNDEPAVLTERRDGVLLVSLNRPDARNAVNAALAEARGIDCVEVDLDVVRGEREPDLTLFG